MASRLARLYGWEGPEDFVSIGIDPGLSATGVAVVSYRTGEIRLSTIRSAFGDFPRRVSEIARRVAQDAREPSDATYWRVLTVEHMKVYPQRRQKGDPNDLIRIAVVEGAILARVDFSYAYAPTAKEWKGSVPKKVHHPRLRAMLEPSNVRASEHAIDAFGLALYGAKMHRHRNKT